MDKNRDAIIDKVVAGKMSMIDAAKLLQCRPLDLVTVVKERRIERAEKVGRHPSR